jgi:hypothetical protein
MATGFIYVVGTVTRSYAQRAFCNVPTDLGDRLYFGPCKMWMRPRMKAEDFVFGISPAGTPSRRIVFVGQIEECITFAEAYRRFPDLQGPEGPIHVRPINGSGGFPQSSYQHIPGSMHAEGWAADLATPDLDRFFVCRERNGWLGRWLGPSGPVIDNEILALLSTCSAYGSAGYLGQNTGTLSNPIAYGGLYTGLHLETDTPEDLVEMCRVRMTSDDLDDERDSGLKPQRRSGAPAPSSTPQAVGELSESFPRSHALRGNPSSHAPRAER